MKKLALLFLATVPVTAAYYAPEGTWGVVALAACQLVAVLLVAVVSRRARRDALRGLALSVSGGTVRAGSPRVENGAWTVYIDLKGRRN